MLADRQGCYLHSSGAILDGQGLLFVGHSEAGKSTISKMLQGQMEVLCDDRNIVRKHPPPPRAGEGWGGGEGFWVYGTWSHGEWPVVSASSAPLRAILFLEKAPENRLVLLEDRREILRRLLACLIKPFVTADWWEKTLTLVERIAREVPCYILRFDKSGGVVEVLRAGCVIEAAHESRISREEGHRQRFVRGGTGHGPGLPVARQAAAAGPAGHGADRALQQ